MAHLHEKLCARCGERLRQAPAGLVERGPFTATLSPLEIRFDGCRIPLAGRAGMLFARLIEAGELSRDQVVAIACGEEASDQTAFVQLCRLRRRLNSFRRNLAACVRTVRSGDASREAYGISLDLARVG